MEAKDSRIKIINEIIAGVKVEFITSILSLENYPCREKVRQNSFYFSCIGGSRQSSQGLLSFFFFTHFASHYSRLLISFFPIASLHTDWTSDVALVSGYHSQGFRGYPLYLD